MNTAPRQATEPVRLVFELARADNPRLYDELVLFQKGAKRVNRLRVLAYDGLLAQYGAFGADGPLTVTVPERRAPAAAVPSLTNGVFGPGLDE